MKKLTLFLLMGFASVMAAKNQEAQYDAMYEDTDQSGIKQIYEIVRQLRDAMGDVPPQMERLAVLKIRIDRREFTPGIARFFRGKIEETIMKVGRKRVVSSPELKTLRIFSTDTSFKMSNTIPNIEELWDIGEKLKVDGFVDGNITKSQDGDILVNLNIIKHKTGELIWNGTFIAGPNENKFSDIDLEYGLHASYGYWAMKLFTQSGTGGNTSATEGLTMNHYTLALSVREAMNMNRTLYFNLWGSIGYLNKLVGLSDQDTFEDVGVQYSLSIGGGVSIVFIQKDDKTRGAWLGANLGAEFDIWNRFVVLKHGYYIDLSNHFAVNFGVNYYPLNSSFTPILTNSYELEMEQLSYEIKLQYLF